MRITEPYTIFKRTLKSGRVVYYYQFRDELGRRSAAYSTGTESFSQAKRVVRQLYNEGKFKSFSGMSFATFSKDIFEEDGLYCQDKKINGDTWSQNTLKTYRNSLKYQLKPFFDDIKVEKINTGVVKDFKKYCIEKGMTVRTINSALQTLSIILKKACERDYLAKMPKLEKLAMEQKKRDLFTIEELTKIVTAGTELKSKSANLIIKLLACTGLRIGEALALMPCNVHENYLDIKHSFSDRYGLSETKTKQSRCVPMPKDLYEELQSVGDDEWVFVDKKKIVGETVAYNLRKCSKIVGIDLQERGLSLHSLRAFFISYLREKNISDAKIRAVVGHADPTMTNVYTYWKPEMFPEVYEAQLELYQRINRGTV